MKQDYTEIVVLLDRSGSMQHGKDDHEGGLMSFVEDQQQLEGDVRFTLIQFDNVEPCEIVYDGVSIAEVDQVKLIPRGGTPLLDAVGRGINDLDANHDGKLTRSEAGNGMFAQALFPILGTNPPRPASMPPLRPDVPCETQEPPNLAAPGGSALDPQLTAVSP